MITNERYSNIALVGIVTIIVFGFFYVLARPILNLVSGPVDAPSTCEPGGHVTVDLQGTIFDIPVGSRPVVFDRDGKVARPNDSCSFDAPSRSVTFNLDVNRQVLSEGEIRSLPIEQIQLRANPNLALRNISYNVAKRLAGEKQILVGELEPIDGFLKMDPLATPSIYFIAAEGGAVTPSGEPLTIQCRRNVSPSFNDGPPSHVCSTAYYVHTGVVLLYSFEDVTVPLERWAQTDADVRRIISAMIRSGNSVHKGAE